MLNTCCNDICVYINVCEHAKLNTCCNDTCVQINVYEQAILNTCCNDTCVYINVCEHVCTDVLSVVVIFSKVVYRYSRLNHGDGELESAPNHENLFSESSDEEVLFSCSIFISELIQLYP